MNKKEAIDFLAFEIQKELDKRNYYQMLENEEYTILCYRIAVAIRNSRIPQDAEFSIDPDGSSATVTYGDKEIKLYSIFFDRYSNGGCSHMCRRRLEEIQRKLTSLF
jgi:hypothetical protein